MVIKTKEKGIELLHNSLPYPHQIGQLDISKNTAIYFNWRKSRYKLDLEFLSVDRVDGGCLVGDDCSILIEHCLKNNIGSVL